MRKFHVNSSLTAEKGSLVKHKSQKVGRMKPARDGG